MLILKTNAPAFIAGITKGMRTIDKRQTKMIVRLTKYANTKMKHYTGNTARTTGNLSRNILMDVTSSGNSTIGTSYVSDRIKYAHAIEKGVSGGQTISGNPYMAFPATSWKKSVSQHAVNGYYIFSRVRRGKYSGKHYTAKAYKDLTSYYKSKMASYKTDISRAILSSIRISGGGLS